MGKGRAEATLDGFFEERTPEQRKPIEAVASAMAAGFRNAVEKACLHAALVYDLFHVVAKYSREVVDVVRTEEAKKQDEAGRKLIKESHHLLQKNESNLHESQREALQAPRGARVLRETASEFREPTQVSLGTCDDTRRNLR